MSPGLVPALVRAPWEQSVLQEAVQRQGCRLGIHGGSFPTRCMGQSKQLPLGTSFYARCKCTHAPNQTEVPKFLVFTVRETHSKCSQGETFAKVDFFSSPFLCAPLVCRDGTRSDLKALSLPRLSRRSAGSTATRRGPSATAFECRSAGAQPEPRENEALI